MVLMTTAGGEELKHGDGSSNEEDDDDGSDSEEESSCNSTILGVAALTCIIGGLLIIGYHMFGMIGKFEGEKSHKSVHESYTPSSFVTNVKGCRHVEWTNTTLSAKEALNMTFPFGKGWPNVSFGNGPVMTPDIVANWVEGELLSSYDPFESTGSGMGGFCHPPKKKTTAPNGRVPIPWPTKLKSDQLGPGEWVGYSRRQVCYIVAKTLLGARTSKYKNGFARILDLKVEKEGQKSCTARTGNFGVAWWNLLTACAADPALENFDQGPMLLVAKAAKPLEVNHLRKAGRYAPLADAALRVCRYDDGTDDAKQPSLLAKLKSVRKGTKKKASLLAKLQSVPSEGCKRPEAHAPGKDFMTGGILGQALHDISESFLGGYVFGNSCGLGGGQDERLMVYMPEVSALVFFLSQDPAHPQLRQPAWVLGARMLMIGLDGTARFDQKMELDPNLAFTNDLVEVELQDTTYNISSSRPLIAFMSHSQGYLNESHLYGPELVDSLHLARRNKHPLQRAVGSEGHAFEEQVRAWYTAVALTSYDDHIQPVLRKVVRSIGTGPWLAGLWWGDSQLGMLATWIGHAIAAETWGKGGLPLHYYIYSDFTENPGNQCFVHSEKNCENCLRRCWENPPPPSAYWMPEYAYMNRSKNPDYAIVQQQNQTDNNTSSNTNSSKTDNNPCVLYFDGDCGQQGIQDVIGWYNRNHHANDLWENIEAVLRDSEKQKKAETLTEETMSVFDLLLLPGDEEEKTE